MVAWPSWPDLRKLVKAAIIRDSGQAWAEVVRRSQPQESGRVGSAARTDGGWPRKGRDSNPRGEKGPESEKGALA